MYSPQVLDHFQNPRNAGEIDHPEGVAQMENPVCGDVLRLTLSVREGRVSDIRFLAKGCVPAMACASAVTELAKGKSAREVNALREEDLIAELGGLPEASSHAVQLALEVLRLAMKSVSRGRHDAGDHAGAASGK